MKSFTVKEIIEYAITIEKESFAFYTQASKIIENPEVKKLVTLLAEEEVSHQNRLLALIKEQKINAAELTKQIKPDTALLEKIVHTPIIVSDSVTADILKIALKREKNTEQIYRMLTSLSDIDSNISRIFEQLCLQEQGHVKKIEYRINHL